MKKNNINQVKMGSVLSYVQMALNVIIGLLYTPVMIRLLGKSEYGLYNTVSSTIAMLSVLSLGFNSAYIRFFADYKRKDDKESIYRLNGLFLLIFVIIGIVALSCGLFLSENLHIVFDSGLTRAEYEIARVLMILLSVNLGISFPMSVFQNIISANERFVFLKTLGIVKNVFSPLVTLPLLLMGYRSIALVAVTLCISVIVDFCYMYYTIAVLRKKFWFNHFEKGLFSNIFRYTIFIAINMIIDQINWNIDKILLGRFCGTEKVAIYSVGYMLYHYYSMFSTAVSSVFTPRIHKIISQYRSDKEKLRQHISALFIKVGRIQFLILALVASGVVFFGKPFIVNIWAGDGYEESYAVALLLILPASIALIQNLGIEIQRAQNLHKFRSYAYAVMAVINLGLSIVLCQKYGAIGSALGTSVSLIVANGLVMNIYYNKRCNIDILLFWKNIARMSLGLIIPTLVGLFLVNVLDQNSLILFFTEIVIYTAVYTISMWFVAMNNSEKSLILGIVHKS